MKTMLKFTLAMLFPVLVTVQASAADVTLPEVTEEGLHRVEDSKLAVVYADPAADLSVYDSVKILDAYVAFKKNWERKQRSSASSLATMVKPADMERMKADLAKEFRDVFTTVLTEGGYKVVDDTGENVLLVRPAVIDLDPRAPDTRSSSQSYTFVESAGEMTLYIELFDSQTSDLLAKAVDRKVDRNTGIYTWANPASNAAAARRIIRSWAEVLRDALDEARQ